MRAAVYRSHGGSDVMKIEELREPQPGPGEVRVRIRVSGVNPTDWKMRESTAAFDRAFQVPNQDGAGEIDAVGPGVDPARAGQRVWVYNAAYQRPFGTGAEECCVPAGQAVPLPAGASFEMGASLGIPAMTAHRALFADGPIQGRTVLVTGGAGAVGHFAIALARWAGAKVISTVSSPEKEELARAAGAHHCVNYRAAGAAAEIRRLAPRGVDRIVEVALAANLRLDQEVLAENGAVAIYAASAGELPIDVRALMFANTALRFILVYRMPEEAKAAAVREITAALEQGALPPMRFQRFRLEQMAQAHDAVKAGAVGKVLVEI